MQSQKLIICLMGPTASGKSRLAIELASKLPCEIVSVDSAMVYRGMDIGTAKPTSVEREFVRHHLIDICDPTHAYSAGQFQKDAQQLIEKIEIPLLVGGTMLYFRALLQGLAPLPSRDANIRAALEQQAKETGWPALHEKLAKIDSQAAARINPNDAQRIQRALEVYELTGQTLTHLQQETATEELPYRLLQLALIPSDRDKLHKHIAQRFEQMLQQGFVEEVEQLKNRGDLHPDLPSMRAVGYRQVWDYLEGTISRDEMQEKAIAATRQLAKRQLTWLRSWPNLSILEADEIQLSNKVLLMIDKSFVS
jgi:tRNA dimethylallyltransferase